MTSRTASPTFRFLCSRIRTGNLRARNNKTRVNFVVRVRTKRRRGPRFDIIRLMSQMWGPK